MELTQAQADKINKMLGVSFIDLNNDDDAEYYLEALEDGECKAEDQAAVEEAHAFIKHILSRSVSEMLKDELPALVEEHGIDAISEVYYAVNRGYEKLARGNYTWSSAVVTEFFEKYYEGTYRNGYLKHLYADDLPAIFTRNINWGGVYEEYLEDHDAIFIDGEHGELAFFKDGGFSDEIIDAFM